MMPDGKLSEDSDAAARLHRRQRRVGLVSAGVALGMLGLAFASVPLYRLFCQQTGYGGTTQRTTEASATVLDRKLTVHFDANAAPGLAWKFEAMQEKLDVRIGETTLAFFRVTDTSDKPATGTAVFNVLPEQVGIHFNKIQCFCFTEQVLQPGERVDMPVVFYVDPDLVKDRDAGEIRNITLSYTFYETELPETQASLPPAEGNDYN